MRTSSVSRLNGRLRRMLKSSSSVIGKGLSGLWQLMIRKRQPRQLSSLYTRCSQTPLDVFIDVLVNKNLSRLIRFGKATPKQLADAWEQLFTEYCELSGTPQYQRMLNIMRQIGSIRSKILAVKTCIVVLNYRYSEKCIATLRRLGYKYKFDPSDKNAYSNDIKSLTQKLKSSEISLIQAENEYKDLISESGEGITIDYFDKTIVELSKFMGFRVNAREVTVTEFVYMQKRMNKEIEILNRKKDGLKGKN